MSSKLSPVDFMDAPAVWDAATDPIPAASGLPVQCVAVLSANVEEVHFIDGTARFVGIYIGDVGQEQLVCVVGGGVSSVVSALIPVGSRISLRSMDSQVINRGALFLQFIGAKQSYL